MERVLLNSTAARLHTEDQRYLSHLPSFSHPISWLHVYGPPWIPWGEGDIKREQGDSGPGEGIRSFSSHIGPEQVLKGHWVLERGDVTGTWTFHLVVGVRSQEMNPVMSLEARTCGQISPLLPVSPCGRKEGPSSF